jgi:hypothetical protein
MADLVFTPACEFMYNSVIWEIRLFYAIANVSGKGHGTVPSIPYGLHSLISVIATET